MGKTIARSQSKFNHKLNTPSPPTRNVKERMSEEKFTKLSFTSQGILPSVGMNWCAEAPPSSSFILFAHCISTGNFFWHIAPLPMSQSPTCPTLSRMNNYFACQPSIHFSPSGISPCSLEESILYPLPAPHHFQFMGFKRDSSIFLHWWLQRGPWPRQNELPFWPRMSYWERRSSSHWDWQTVNSKS